MVLKAQRIVRDLVEQGLQLQELLTSQGWEFCFIGGIAVQRWSEPRFTKDMDLTVLTGYGPEEQVARFLLSHFTARIHDPIEFAVYNRVVLLQNEYGTGIDISLGALPFEEDVVRRATIEEYVPGISLRICTAEDLIIMKSFAARPLDWHDVRGVLVRQGTKNLDWPYIYRHLTVLAELKEEPEITTELEKLRGEVAGSEP